MLITTPRPYQHIGIEMIERKEASYISWEMGCGKTLAPIAYIDKHRPGMTLIICPKAVVPVWPAEFNKHLGKDHNLHVVPLDFLPGRKGVMSVKKRLEYAREQWIAANKAKWPIVFVVNYDAVRQEPLASAFLKPMWDLVIVDELHKGKSPSGATSRFLAKLGKRAKKRVGLSGTPMPHSPLDVWAQFRFLDKSIFGWSFTAFKSRYAIMGGAMFMGRPTQVVNYKNLEELNRKFYSIAHRVTKAEVLTHLPPFTHIERYVELDKDARKIYDDMEDDLLSELKGGEIATASNAMVKVTRLQQITSGFVKTEEDIERSLHDAKVNALIDVLEDIDPKMPVAVFCRFHWDLDAVERVAKDLGRKLYKLSSKGNDVGNIWKPEPGGIAAIQIQAGGTGIDLTATSYNILLSQTWNMGDYDQLLSRSHRHGQSNAVTYIHILVRRSVDEKIRKALVKRAELVNRVLSQDEFNRMVLTQIQESADGEESNN